MRKALFGAVALAIGLFTASAAQAASFTYNFCGFVGASGTCPADLTEASLTFDEVAGGDVNDYTLTVRFVGTDPDLYIDSIDFTADMDFASKPVLTTAPDGTAIGDWTAFYNKIDDGQGCTADKNSNKFVCVISDGNDADPLTNPLGPSFAGSNTWVFDVDFTGDGVLDANSAVNLRANFSDADGNTNGQGIPGNLSPGGVFQTTETPTTDGTPTTGNPTTSGTPTTDGSVPEPALLSLLGIGLAGAAYRIRRKG